MTTAVKPILRWPGGKTRLLKRILPLPPHVCYCEPFSGGLAVFMAKERSQVEIVNDINGDLVSLYLGVQKHLPEMLRQIEMVVSSRQLLHAFVAQPGLTDIERAVRFFVRNRTSFGGSGRSYGVSKTPGGGSAFFRDKNIVAIEALHARLNGVSIEHISYERCLKNYDCPETLFFLDPPYLGAQLGAYDAWTEEQMRSLKYRVAALQGNWILTVDDSPFNRSLFHEFSIEAVQTRSGAVNQARFAKCFGELIVRPGK